VYAAGLSAGGSREDGAGEGLKFFRELVNKGNFAAVVGDARSLANGTTPILIRWDYLARGDRDRFAGTPKIEVVVPRSGLVGGLYVQAISAGAAHPNAARLWMEYLYSDEAQLTWLFNSGHPIRFEDLVRTGKVPVAGAERLPEIKEREAAEPVFPTPEEQERARETIINGWDGVVGVKFQCTPPPGPRPPISRNDTPRQASVLPAE
jgi:putative spermidine/putrescine transport system substrate-binding protein